MEGDGGGGEQPSIISNLASPGSPLLLRSAGLQPTSRRSVQHMFPLSETHLQSDVGPVDSVVGDVEVERRGLLDAGERDGHVVVVGLQGDAADVGVAREEQEGLRYDAGSHVGDEFEADGTATLNALRLVETEVTAAAVTLRTRVRT